MFDSKQFLSQVSQSAGVYKMLGTKGKVLYVGKAKNLKKRLSSYFKTHDSPRLNALVNAIDHIEVTITPTEKDALLLENSLIKALKPKYNIDLKDDKSYPYLYLHTNHTYPSLTFYRGTPKKQETFYGPFVSAWAVRETLNLIQKTFKLRGCTDNFFANRSRPCLQYQINRCSAPCVDYISEADYQQAVTAVHDLLNGNSREVIDQLIAQMTAAAEAQDYEKAANVRDQIQILQKLLNKQSVSAQTGSFDVIGLYQSHGLSVIQLLVIREGDVQESKPFYFEQRLAETAAEFMSAFIAQYYLSSPDLSHHLPSKILLSHSIEDAILLEAGFESVFDQKVSVSDKFGRQNSQWLTLALENARNSFAMRQGHQSVTVSRIEALASYLKIDSLQRIECFDISHLQGEATIGSCVVFIDGKPDKSQYRAYNLQTNSGDDYAAMREVLTRRYTKMLTEDRPKPDLLLIDGGKGQLAVACEVLINLQLLDIPLIGVAKGEGRKVGLETLFICLQATSEPNEVHLMPNDKALHLIQHIRDESHRHAITKHRKKRQSNQTQSVLEGIPGVGPKKRQALYKNFGGIRGLKEASKDQLTQVPGINDALAERIIAHLENLK